MKKLYVELADTHLKREYGLMNRRSLAKNSGMLFKFPYSNRLGFWMRDTYLPLDIAFINDDGVILQIESMSPLSTRTIRSNHICRYALEVNKGWFENNDIKKGASIKGLVFGNIRKEAQLAMPVKVQDPPVDGIEINQLPDELPPMDPAIGALPEVPEQDPSEPDVILNLSFKDRIKEAHLKDKKLLIIYQTKEGLTLPPKVISPPYQLEKGEEGKFDSLVTCWDDQVGGWKSFIIDNIIDMEDVENMEDSVQE